MTAAAASTPGLWAQCGRIILKDVLLEWRGRARLNAVVFFALLTLLLFSFAVGPQHALLVKLAPGFLWLAVLLASVLSLSEAMRQESEQGALEGLRLLPVDPKAIYLGKALANTLFLWLLACVLVPISVALYGATITLGVPRLLGVLFVGVSAICAPGTLYATIATYARARDILLPLLLFPVLVPGLVAAVKATALVYQGDPMNELGSWVGLLIGFNVVYWSLCMTLFERVIES